ncbi:MAG TPA: hypothetical protein VN366_08245, partial [Feifaniaceae bacterium]|nr:hypothetical protein [Feifaniaceae bacterium]
GRVLLDVFGRERNAEKAAELDGMYESIIASLQVTGTEGALTPADLTELGFPEAPDGCYSYYNPITGQFLIIPNEIDILSGPYDSQVLLHNADYGLLVTGNWTDRFSAIYESGTIEQCYAAYLGECLDIVETVFNQQLIYRDLKYLSGSDYGELIKASFYIDPDGTAVRCFAELATRGSNDQYVQGTFTVSDPDNKAARAAFNVVMGNSQIVFVLS